MNVAVVLTGIGVLPERRENVSGHVQIPLKTCEMLRDAGVHVTIVATAQSDGTAMPACLPNGVEVTLVTDGRQRGQLGRQNGRRGYKFLDLMHQIRETVAAVRAVDADIVHVISNRPDAGGLSFAADAGVTTSIIEHGDFDDVESFSDAVFAAVRGSGADLVVMGGFLNREP